MISDSHAFNLHVKPRVSDVSESSDDISLFKSSGTTHLTDEQIVAESGDCDRGVSDSSVCDACDADLGDIKLLN
jgi:hypothetical protein